MPYPPEKIRSMMTPEDEEAVRQETYRRHLEAMQNSPGLDYVGTPGIVPTKPDPALPGEAPDEMVLGKKDMDAARAAKLKQLNRIITPQ